MMTNKKFSLLGMALASLCASSFGSITFENVLTDVTIEIPVYANSPRGWTLPDIEKVGIDSLPLIYISPRVPYEGIDYCTPADFTPETFLPLLQDRYNITNKVDDEDNQKWLAFIDQEPDTVRALCIAHPNYLRHGPWIAKMVSLTWSKIGSVGAILLYQQWCGKFHAIELSPFNEVNVAARTVEGVDVITGVNDGEGPLNFVMDDLIRNPTEGFNDVFLLDMRARFADAAIGANGSVAWTVLSNTGFDENIYLTASGLFTGYYFYFNQISALACFFVSGYIIACLPKLLSGFKENMDAVSDEKSKKLLHSALMLRLFILVPELLVNIPKGIFNMDYNGIHWGFSDFRSKLASAYMFVWIMVLTDTVTIFYSYDLYRTIEESRKMKKTKSLYARAPWILWIAMGTCFIFSLMVYEGVYVMTMDGLPRVSNYSIFNLIAWLEHGVFAWIILFVACKMGKQIKWAKERVEATASSNSSQSSIRRLEGLLLFQKCLIIGMISKLFIQAALLNLIFSAPLTAAYKSPLNWIGYFVIWENAGHFVCSMCQVLASLQLPDGSQSKATLRLDTTSNASSSAMSSSSVKSSSSMASSSVASSGVASSSVGNSSAE